MNPIVISVVNHIIKRTNEWNTNKSFQETIFLSGKRIQRLLYLCQIEYVKKYNILMFDDKFHTWPSGPVINSVYDILINFQPKKDFKYPLIKKNNDYKLNRKICKVIDDVLLQTNNIDTLDLEEKVKNDGLWEKYCVKTDPDYDNQFLQTIPNEELIEYYSKITKSKTFIKRKFTVK